MPDMDQLLGELQGTLSASLEGIQDEGDSKIAIIKLKYDLKSSNDASDAMSELMSKNVPEGMEMELDSFAVEFSFKGEATLHWNITAGVASSLEIETESRQHVDMSMTMMQQEVEVSTGYAGDMQIKLGYEIQ